MTIKTASWSTRLLDDHARIGISRGTRGQKALSASNASWSQGSGSIKVSPEEYYAQYQCEDLSRPDRQQVAAAQVATLLCYERAGVGHWCHRAIAAEWLAEGLGCPVPEFGYEHLDQYPLMPLGCHGDVLKEMANG